VRVWEVATGSQIGFCSGHTDVVTCVAYSPDGQCLASASDDKSVKIWDAATGLEKLTFSRHGAPVWNVTFSRDGRWLASAGDDVTTKGDCELKVWDAQTGAEALTLRDHIMGVSATDAGSGISGIATVTVAPSPQAPPGGGAGRPWIPSLITELSSENTRLLFAKRRHDGAVDDFFGVDGGVLV
jgi:WD40 repeat protein